MTKQLELSILALAEQQYGVISIRQLRSLGVGRGSLKYRLQSKRLHCIHRGVYASGHGCLTRNGHWMAAVLAGGEGAVLSHASAASLWDLRASASASIDVTVRSLGRPGPKGVRLHCVRRLDAADVTMREGTPVTSVARTLLDLAEVVPARQLERAVEEAERLRIFDRAAVEAICDRIRGRRGIRPLRAALGRYDPVSQATRSELERRFLEHCSRAGIPRPSVNSQVAGFEVDMCWLERRLIVELDGHAFHGTRKAFEADRIRDAELQAAGYQVVRITQSRLEHEADVALELLRLMLEKSQPERGIV